ncbi:hypothetical protein CC1G_12906 [Coprinopsis cinerea okayama7|uniref:Uncharacterized protein n=1 Tax=Coprinopsis cinerea (strain Okayama-7 / 130 / ATCC MYA-4618 / FGSC 9003) TaxID=240176 RepID=A8N9N8_COPC7|nr:hypothetical protein CC1G_12906 [Coprinopsis cinerea okayama7\|eukprot:XP_001831544.2 hypothetical protein CC1G_12906 [Coprinopsis cinerea okayama7\
MSKPSSEAVETYLDSKNEYEATARIRYIVALVNETEKDKTRKWLEAKEAQKDGPKLHRSGRVLPIMGMTSSIKFRKYFCLLPNKETAKKQLKQLHMGKNTSTQKPPEAAGYGDEWALDQYKGGLNPELRLRVATQFTARPAEQKKVPPTLQE